VGASGSAKAPVLNAGVGAKSSYLAGRVKQYAGVMVQRAGDVMAGRQAGDGEGGDREGRSEQPQARHPAPG